MKRICDDQTRKVMDQGDLPRIFLGDILKEERLHVRYLIAHVDESIMAGVPQGQVIRSGLVFTAFLLGPRSEDRDNMGRER